MTTPHPLPPAIEALTRGLPCEADTVGMSSHTVLLYPDRVLKIGPVSAETDNELTMLRFLEGKLNVPRVLAYEEIEGTRYLLCSRIEGRMAFHPSLMANLHRVADLLAEALHLLWAVPLAGCPDAMGLDGKLRLIGEALAKGEIDTDNVEPETYGPDGFASPEALYRWLLDNRPPETPVFTHGDLCMPNILLQPDGTLAFIDLGRAAPADPWCDIALAWRSLKHNCNGIHGTYPGWTENLLFDALGIAPDPERLRYYLLLDELQ